MLSSDTNAIDWKNKQDASPWRSVVRLVSRIAIDDEYMSLCVNVVGGEEWYSLFLLASSIDRSQLIRNSRKAATHAQEKLAEVS